AGLAAPSERRTRRSVHRSPAGAAGHLGDHVRPTRLRVHRSHPQGDQNRQNGAQETRHVFTSTYRGPQKFTSGATPATLLLPMDLLLLAGSPNSTSTKCGESQHKQRKEGPKLPPSS